MRLTVFAATLAFLLWGAPAFAGSAPDSDGDGISDGIDNCSDVVNSAQDDTDFDDCGNLCDGDYDQEGIVGFPDFLAFATAYLTTDDEKDHTEPVGDGVGFPDFLWFGTNFNVVPGPSGTTAGTVACP